MSLKSFVETTANIINKFGSTLPIPYIEKIEVHDSLLDVQTAIYIEIPADEYERDEGASFLETFDDLIITIMPIFDRGSFTDFCGIDEDGVLAPGNFQNYPLNAWTNVSTGVESPIKYMYNRTFADILVTKMSQFDWGSIVSDSDTAGEVTIDSSFDLDAFLDAFPLGEPYQLPNLSNGDPGGGVDREDVVSWLDDAVESETFSSRRDAAIYILDYCLNLAIENNNRNIVTSFYGVKEYTSTAPVLTPSTTPSSYGVLSGYNMIMMSVLANTSYGRFSDYTKADIMINEDGSAYVKFIHNSQMNEFDIHPALYHAQLSTGTTNMGFVAFSLPWDPRAGAGEVSLIREAYRKNSGQVNFWETSISGYSHVKFIQNDGLYLEPLIMYEDDNGNLYERAMRSIDGSYYEYQEELASNILADMNAIPQLGSLALQDTNSAFMFLLNTAAQDPMDMVPIMNQYRRAYPDKSTTTVKGQFYNSFAEILYNANTLIQRGTKLQKTLKNNPIIKDMRGYTASTYSADPTFSFNDTQWYSLFNLEDALWSRYTEVIGFDESQKDNAAAQVTITQADSGYVTTNDNSTTHINGGEYNYNFIDHGFAFFNYEKALKTTSIFARHINVDRFEKYFGQEIMNSLFTMERIYLGKYFSTQNIIESTGPFGTVVGSTYDDALPVGIMEVQDININNATTKVTITAANNEVYSDASINADKFVSVIENPYAQTTAANGYISNGDDSHRISNDFGGADAMTDKYKYSFIKLRGFCPISTQEDAGNPFYMGETYAQIRNRNYRLACFEIQTNDYWDGFEPFRDKNDDGTMRSEFITSRSKYAGEEDIEVGGLLKEIKELDGGIGFRSCLLVRDKTFKAVSHLYDKINSQFERFSEYAEIAGDICSYNEAEEHFNDYFARTMETNFPNGPDAPYFMPIVYTLIMEDILYSAYGGGELQLTDEIKKIVRNVSPQTGTLTGVQNFLDRIQTIQQILFVLTTVYEDEDFKDMGHIYGHDPMYGSYSETLSQFNATVADLTSKPIGSTISTSTSGNAWEQVWNPGGTYENFPLYPSTYTESNTTVVIPSSPPEDPARLATGTYIEDLIADSNLAEDIRHALVSMINEKLAALTDSLESWNMQDFIEDIMGTVGSTFPDLTDYILSDVDSMSSFARLGSSVERDRNVYGMSYRNMYRLCDAGYRSSNSTYESGADLATVANFIKTFTAVLGATYFNDTGVYTGVTVSGRSGANALGFWGVLPLQGGAAFGATYVDSSGEVQEYNLAGSIGRNEYYDFEYYTADYGLILSNIVDYTSNFAAAWENLNTNVSFQQSMSNYIESESFTQLQSLADSVVASVAAGYVTQGFTDRFAAFI